MMNEKQKARFYSSFIVHHLGEIYAVLLTRFDHLD